MINRDNQGKWLDGVSGNPAGRPKRKTLTELIHAKLDDTPEGWEKFISLVLTMMFNDKNKDLIKTLWQYTDGMPKSSIEVTGKDGGPLNINLINYGDKPPVQLPAEKLPAALTPSTG